MAEHLIQTTPPENGIIFQLRYDTYTNWMRSRRILKQGEAAIAVFPNSRTIENTSNSEPGNTPPAVGMKIGDGESYFFQLPWVQAIAADVYTWAKSNQPPAANTIPGLNDYIANYLEENDIGGGSGSGTFVSRQYQIIRGTDENVNKYYLRYKNDDSETWFTDLNHYIDVSAYEKIVKWIGEDIKYPNLGTRTGIQILTILQDIAYTDTPQNDYFVTAVNQSNGTISVSRAQPSFSNLTGNATVEQGGTGRTSLPLGEILLGNGTNPISTVQIADAIDNNTKIVPNYLIKAYVDEKTAGLTGAMHYIGETSVEINGVVDPEIQGYVFSRAQPGDVITNNLKEYVWTGYTWRLLGDEGSYAVKGSIKDIDIDTEANIQQSKISGLIEALSLKVNVEAGKMLSSNDYSNEDKTKLMNIEDGAQVNYIEHIFLNNTELIPTIIDGLEKSVNLSVNIFTDADRTKLDSIESGAQINTIQGITLNGDPQTPDTNKIVNLSINEFTQGYKDKLDNIENGAQVNVISGITVNGNSQPIDSNKIVNLSIEEFTKVYKDKLDTITEYAKPNVIESIYLNGSLLQPNADKRVDINIISLTQKQVNKLNNLPADANANLIESISLNGTVQPIVNKNVNLLINEFTEAYEQKLNSIQTGAQVNSIERIIINRKEYTPVNKTVSITIDQAALDLDVLVGAIVPDENNLIEEVEITQNHKLLLSRIAKTGDIKDAKQTDNTFIVLNCGTSTTVV